jgi:aminopeptidase 2
MCSGPVLTSSIARQVLPANVKPSNYKLSITPGLETLRFDGIVKVDLKVIESTATIICNQNELEIYSAKVGTLNAVVSLDQENELATFTFDSEFKAGTDIVLEIVFRGVHNDKMAGFYKSYYTLAGVKKNMVVTQFEATDCRRCFPSWDEVISILIL